MRTGVILKYYLRDVLGKSMLVMVGIYSLFSMVIPLIVAALVKDAEMTNTSDIYFSLLVYMCVYAGVYANQYTRMHIALGTTRKAIWANQTVIGTLILSVAAVALSVAAQWLTMAVGNALAGWFNLAMTIDNALIIRWMMGANSSWGLGVLLMVMISFVVLSAVECMTYFFLRWKKHMLLVSLVLGLLLIWLMMTHTAQMVEGIIWLFDGGIWAVCGKLALLGAALLGISYIPLSRLPIKN